MAWAKLDDSFYDHPKFLQAGPYAGWLYMRCLGYAARHLTDGFIPAAVVRQLAEGPAGPKKLAAKLVEVRLWELADGGYQIHDYLVYNPPAARVRADRARKARNSADYRIHQAATDGPVTEPVTGYVTNAVTGRVTGDEGGDVTGHVPRPVPVPVPVPVPDPVCEASLHTAAQHRAWVQKLESEIGRHEVFAHLDARALANQHARDLRTPNDVELAIGAINDSAAKTWAPGLPIPQLERDIGTFILQATKNEDANNARPALKKAPELVVARQIRGGSP